jgi:hypothetical protein
LKHRGIIITTIIFFLLINTNYYWEGKLGLFAFPIFLLLAAIYLGLTVALLRQFYLLIKEKFKQKNRLAVFGLLITVLLLTYFKPLGLVDFENLEGNDVLVAERESAANCLTTVKLKNDFTFRERIGCFGTSEINGTFRIVKDTIYFDNVKLGRGENYFYKFAVIKPTKFNNSKILGDLIRYKNSADAVGDVLWITKNELQKLNDKSRSANIVFAAMLADE